MTYKRGTGCTDPIYEVTYTKNDLHKRDPVDSQEREIRISSQSVVTLPQTIFNTYPVSPKEKLLLSLSRLKKRKGKPMSPKQSHRLDLRSALTSPKMKRGNPAPKVESTAQKDCFYKANSIQLTAKGKTRYFALIATTCSNVKLATKNQSRSNLTITLLLFVQCKKHITNIRHSYEGHFGHKLLICIQSTFMNFKPLIAGNPLK